MSAPIAASIIRGKVIGTDLVEFGGRNGDLRFLTPDPRKIVDLLPLGNPRKMSDLYVLSLDEILDYLCELGSKLSFKDNAHLQQAYELSVLTAPTTPPVLKSAYESIGAAFSRAALEEIIESVGRPFLEGWVEKVLWDGRRTFTRAFGARCLHIVAGNSPMVSVATIIRNAITRSDAIIKAPANDPFTALAVARTMTEMAPEHPVTKHIAVAYWKGGDEPFEQKLYQPHNIEKIVAWGGFASVKHVTRYIQPGLELISLDPKRSLSFVGKEAFTNEDTMDEVANRAAADIGVLNQEACVCARVIYVASGTTAAGIARIERFGERVYQKLLGLPEGISTAAKNGINAELRRHLQGVESSDDWYRVIGGNDGEGAIIVSKLSEPVDFAAMLNNRVANLVPVNGPEDVLPRLDAYSQTVGVYPEELIPLIRDRLALSGAQRVVSLGYAGSASLSTVQDGLEPLRRMCKWINNERCDPESVRPIWL